MKALLAVVQIVPVLAEPSLRATQVTELLLGEGATVVEEAGDFLRIETTFDHYPGWVHRGYTLSVDRSRHDAWVSTAAYSLAASIGVGDATILVPHRGRVQREGTDRVRLPDGRAGRLLDGTVLPLVELIAAAQRVSPAMWAWQQFADAPYRWGGLTAAGIDCSGLVQTTFFARGVPLPRDARDQVGVGEAVAIERAAPGDLLFFRSAESERIGHVAILDVDDMIVHATVATGRVTRERWDTGQRAALLRPLLVAVRRLT